MHPIKIYSRVEAYTHTFSTSAVYFTKIFYPH